VYLLDDPLSAVDIHVGRHLFDDCICDFLQGKTRVLVTHQLQYLQKVDSIVILNNVSLSHYITDALNHTYILYLTFFDVSRLHFMASHCCLASVKCYVILILRYYFQLVFLEA
jgi:ABC-type Mn2+/Zn2+ transport system ATPase subunit